MPAVLIMLTAGVGTLVPAQAALASVRAMATPTATGAIVSGDKSTKCVDDLGNATKNDTPIVIWDCNGSPEQAWTVESDGTLQVDGKCLDIYRDEKTSKAQVELWTCTGGANQQWEPASGTLVNPISGKCLDDPRWNTTNGTHLELYKCGGGLNQQWQLPSAAV
jgi:Ricin-type beta-trefoil lectin domain